ncbi:uncharacterized protein PHACADRAFT_203230 [Phanerochaete carnosa HHB-10118-sp]|uniref:Uncharacterized protein n=1 Tax=Phanerochaete carnosa (strain HHB-10118-sp) TaxID=650164 RepID=K5WD57_PHACS|nr:uncharacterized protein PHACADRAFT_203230 [Phanerochaete carnosa HHB-10118-sp]EKM48117.1 hypothetical protein PHACADRAFT_203230 [Phanerochaete carnosa HHB-10118-sp]
MQTDEKDDHVKALLLAVATFLRDTVCKAYGALREKDRLVQESERKRARLGQEIGTLNEEASKREQLLEDAIATADRGASEAARLKGEVQKLEGAKQADKKKIAGLQMEAEQARSTERRLRNKVTDLEAELQKTTAELETQRESAEQQRQENEDLRQQSQIEYSFDEPGPLDAFGEFVQGSSRSQSWETSSVVYAEDIDLDSSPSRPSTPAPSASHSSRAPSVASSRVSSKTFRLRSTFSSQARMASGSGAVPQRPKFVSDWSLDPPASKRKRVAADESSKKFPIKVDANGRPIGQLQIGPRARLNKYN